VVIAYPFSSVTTQKVKFDSFIGTNLTPTATLQRRWPAHKASFKNKTTGGIYRQEFSLWNGQLPDLTPYCTCCQRQSRKKKGR